MSRRNKPAKRIPQPDAKFLDTQITTFMNHLMIGGKKSIAEKIVYAAFDLIQKRVKDEEPLEVFKKGIKNATPLVEVKARRVGGSTYQVPLEVRGERGFAIACKNVIKFARQRSGLPMAQKLADEILSAYRNEGSAVRKKDEVHRMAEGARAFAHYRF